jgi:NAD(P)-dependent dehydrogenase (short-subunit alcohol dehydrogenase family)
MEVNYFGVVAITQKFLPLIRQHKGRIINISSLLGFFSPSGSGMYSTSKYALEALTDSLRRELTPLGVAVVSVNPGLVKTSMEYKSIPHLQSLATDPQVSAVYPLLGRTLDKVQPLFAKADSPDVTTHAICAGLFESKPKVRYYVGSLGGAPAFMVAFVVRTLPTWLLDLLLVVID